MKLEFNALNGDLWRGLRLVHSETDLESSGLMTLPASSHLRFGRPAVLTPGLHSGLRLYASQEWEKQLRALGILPDLRHEAKLTVQLMQSNSAAVEVGVGGNLTVPLFLRNLGRLKDRVLVVSSRHYLELWDPIIWSVRDLKRESLARYGVA